MIVGIGGTFDRLHKGHEVLLKKAFEVGDKVLIGITSDKLAAGKGEVQPFDVRKRNVAEFVEKIGKPYEILVLNDIYGITLRKGLDALVVSSETLQRAEKINRMRVKKKLRKLKIVVVKKVLAEDLFPISSTRIRAGEINRLGKRLKPLTIALGSTNPVKVEATKAVLAKIFPALEMRLYPRSVESGVGEQPFEGKTVKGARNRALNAIGDCDYGIGIEAGLFYSKPMGRYFDVQYCAIVDKYGRMTLGHGPGFSYPPEVVEVVKRGRSIEEAFEELYGEKKIGQSIGAIGLLSKGHTDRVQITQQAVLMAFVPRLHGWEG
ncbi:MAG: inosine/xanthosine triphosphatase [Thermoplasmata archaeon]|nr:inosine/xanthosine triphosphatase [Thermoplasmata archaeon]